MHGSAASQKTLALRPLLKLSALIDQTSLAAAHAAVWLVFICALVSAFNAISRYAFDLSSNAWLEMQWYMFGAIVLLGAPHILKTNGHVRVDLFYARLSDRAKAWFDATGLIVFLIPFCVLMIGYSWPWFVEAWVSGETSPNAGGLIRWPVKILLPIGFALLLAQGISEIIKRIAALRGLIALDVHYEKPVQ